MLRTVVEGAGALQVNEVEELEVIFPAETKYFLEIGKTFLARWRPGLTSDGIWSFWCEVGSEKAWLETDGTNWQINLSIPAPQETSVSAPASPPLGA